MFEVANALEGVKAGDTLGDILLRTKECIIKTVVRLASVCECIICVLDGKPTQYVRRYIYNIYVNKSVC